MINFKCTQHLVNFNFDKNIAFDSFSLIRIKFAIYNIKSASQRDWECWNFLNLN